MGMKKSKERMVERSKSRLRNNLEWLDGRQKNELKIKIEYLIFEFIILETGWIYVRVD